MGNLARKEMVSRYNILYRFGDNWHYRQEFLHDSVRYGVVWQSTVIELFMKVEEENATLTCQLDFIN